ncbi:hypothetical protein [Chitinophaga polysaccharea]|uniref:hypothetical protein n=1 Tax=Chitinophaga polysaccharea TaxID=1293035 RepID=UPI00115B4CCB|nr:hypothetical protein [Chitinophaga polysaccharea]
MKRLFFILIVLSCVLTVHAQQGKDDYKIMVDSAITIKYTQYLDTSKKRNSEYYLENLYLLNEQDQPLNSVSSSNKFKFINVYDDRNRKVLSKGIYAWKVFTTLNKNKFVITIINLYITYKKRNYDFSSGGGSQTVYEYSCDEGKWRLITSENWGI